MPNSKSILILFIAVILAYGSSIFYGFSQDDWFHLLISRATNLEEFLAFFHPGALNWIFFRPLSTQLPYFLSTWLFPLSGAPYFMHLVMLALHTLNAYLTTKIARLYLKPTLALILGIFYAISSLHFLSLFYIGAIQQLISATFSLLAIYHLLSAKRTSFWVLSLLTAMALLSKELSLRLPLILFLLSYLNRPNFWLSIKQVVGPIIISLAYLGMRLMQGTELATEYTVVTSISSTLATVMWYLLFLLGFPEHLLDFGLSGGRIDWLSFLHSAPTTTWSIILGALILVATLIYALGHSLYTRQVFPSVMLWLLALVSLAPILLLPTHRYPHYLDLSILFLGIFALKPYAKVSSLGILAFFLVSLGMFSSISLEHQTHWTIKRALDSRALSAHFATLDACHKEEGVVFQGTPWALQEISYAMSGANGPRVICDNPSLEVYYKELP